MTRRLCSRDPRVEFPPISHVVEWPTLFGGGAFGVNKVVLLMWVSVRMVFLLFVAAGARARTHRRPERGRVDDRVHPGPDRAADDGPEGLRFTPFLLTLFTFVLTCNIWGLIPGVQMPVNARIALPVFMALVGVRDLHTRRDRHQGADQVLQVGHVPPGVPR